MLKRCFVLLLVVCLLTYIPVTGYAGPKEDYEEAYKIYLAVGASAAAYHGRIGELANRYLEQDGWQVDHYVQAQGHTGARYLIARKEGVPYYLVGIVGTENDRDVKIDLKVEKVCFAGSTAEEFAANAARKDVPDSEPKVHKGFNEFVQAGPSAVLRNPHQDSLSLPDLLLADKTRKLYLTGHSLGGAAATLAGARLLDHGVSPEQIEVVPFGAPAVGNAAFAAKYGATLPLTRVVNSGDKVTGILQGLVGGYQQFGREIKLDPPAMVDDAHQLTGYIDAVIKNYYDKRRLALEAGVQLPVPPAAKQAAGMGRVYIASLQNNLPADLTADFWYMNEVLQAEYERLYPDYVAADSPAWREAATAANCRWAIVSSVSASRVKEEKDTYYITVNQTVYDVTTGAVADTAIFSTGTYSLTPLEAFIHAFKDINTGLGTRLPKN